MPTHRHLLLLDTHGLTIWRARARGFDPAGRFPSDGDGPRAFAVWLAAQAGSTRLTLVVDLPDEAYALERLPRARGGDRAALLQRRLAQHSFGSPCAAALPLGTDAEAPRHERVLLCALARPEPLAPWLAVLIEQRASVTGVHLVALVLDSLVNRLARRRPELQERFLLVSEQAGGIRHSLFEHGRLRYSRQLATTGADAVQRTRAYLYAHDLIEHGASLRVVELGSQQHTAAFSPPAPATGTESLALDPRSLCRELGIDCADEADASMLLILRQACRTRDLPHCAPAEVRQMDSLRRLGHRIGSAGLGIGIVAALFSAWLAAGNQQSAAQINDLTAAANRQQIRHDSLLASLPPLPAPPAVLGQILDTLTRQAAQDGDPQRLLSALGDALDAHPAIALRTLSWSRTRQPGEQTGGPLTLVVALDLPPAANTSARDLAALRSGVLAHLARHDDIRTVLRPHPVGQDREPIRPRQSGSSSAELHIELQDLRQERAPS